MYKKNFVQFIVSSIFVVLSFAGCSQPGPSSQLSFTNVSYDYSSGCLTGTTNATDGRELTFECDGKSTKSVVQNGTVSFHVDGNIVKRKTDGGKIFSYAVRGLGFSNVINSSFVFLPYPKS